MSSMFDPTAGEIAEAHARARGRISVRAEAKLSALDHNQTVANALRKFAVEKEQVIYAHWKDRLWARWHRRIERRIARKLGRPFELNSISATSSGLAGWRPSDASSIMMSSAGSAMFSRCRCRKFTAPIVTSTRPRRSSDSGISSGR